MNLGPLEIGLIILAILLLFGYKKLPDASRSLGRSLRIFKGEMKGMKDDDAGSRDGAAAAPARGALLPAADAQDHRTPAGWADVPAHDVVPSSTPVDDAR